MANGPRWSEDELKALAACAGRRGALKAFCARYPHHTRDAATAKLGVLRRRSEVADVDHNKAKDVWLRPRRPDAALIWS